MVRRRDVARRLEAVRDFEEPSPSLEQYSTPPEIAAHVCHLASVHDDLAGATVLDLGTGTGMLALGASCYAPRRVVGVDVDRSALSVACENVTRVDTRPTPPVDWIAADVRRLPVRAEFESRDDTSPGTASNAQVTVISNPPFGARNGSRGADRPFLEASSAVATVSYTIHNEGSASFVESYVDELGGDVTHAFRASFDLDRRFEFHDEHSRTIESEVFRAVWDGG